MYRTYYSSTQLYRFQCIQEPLLINTTYILQLTTENPTLHDEYLQSMNSSEYPTLADRLTMTNEHCTQGWSVMGSYTACSD